MTRKLTASVREAPATVPALAALALFVIWATDQAGYPVTHWAPGGLIVLALLCLALGLVGLRVAEVPVAVRIALACLAAYTALSFLSILWAGVPADAWEGADRTLLYLAVFALFALWRQRGASAALLVGAWTLAMTALAVFVAVHIDAATASRLHGAFSGGRLVYPSGYANANAAEWMIAFWPALLLASSNRLPWGLRGVFAGAAVLLASVALLSQSRGSLYATPVMLALVFAFLPGRVRLFATVVPIAAGIAAAAPAVLRVGNHLNDQEVVSSTLHAAIPAMLAAAVAVGLLVAAAAAIESRRSFSAASRRRMRRGLGAVAIATLVAVLAGGWVAAGDPATRARHAWDTFKSGRGYGANGSGARLTSGLGSQRYDFYRVALDEFVAHPLIGTGADNFAAQYLVHGRSDETPHYPHSVELRTLAETGIAGTLLAIVGLAAALWASVQAWRSSRARADDLLGPVVAGAALSAFAYWGVHGSFDWFFEFAGLGAPAFAMLGVACALAPRRQGTSGSAQVPTGSAPVEAAASRPAEAAARRAAERAPTIRRGSGRRLLQRARRLWLGAAVLTFAAATASLAAPWLSGLEIDRATSIWARAPRQAYARLDEAARLNPLSDAPYLLAGSVALRFDDLARADRDFSLALGRVPGGAYATLERGAIASSRGERQLALKMIERAASLDPRNHLILAALRVARAGHRLDIEELNRAILLSARKLG